MFGIHFPRRSGRTAQRKASLARRARRRLRRHPEHGGGGQSAPAGGFQGDLLALHNQARPANYRLNADLCQSAQSKADEMARTHRMEHDQQWWKRIEAAGYHYSTCGENIGEGFDSAESVMRAWLNSPPHRKNIMNGKFTEIGFGRSGSYWCAHFGDR